MKPYWLLVVLLVVKTVATAQPRTNFDFEQRTATRQPAGWTSFGNGYSFTLDSTTKHQGRYSLQITDKGNKGFGAANWLVPASFTGKNLTLTGYIKTQDTGLEPNTYAGLWMRIDDEDQKMVAFDNMQNRGIKGTTDWQQYTITLPIPDKAASIFLGGLLVGKGTAWLDDLELTVDGKPFEKAPAKVVKLAKAQADTAYAKGSGISLTNLTKQQIDNLAVLGKVWGFVKYYHPAIAGGDHNMDAELFRVMPKVINTKSVDQRSTELLTWLNTFGTVTESGRQSLPDTAQALHTPDLAWLTDSKLVNPILQAQLTSILQARRTNDHYYIGMMKQVGNPEFKHEAAYQQMITPDAGYRLLALYRFWNIIQYFFPYKHLIGEDWNKVLPEYIPAFVQANDSLSYRLTALSLIGRIHDTHANLWGDQLIQQGYKGLFYSPIQVKFVGNQFVVANYYSESLGAKSGLVRGDVIKLIDEVPIAKLLESRKPYYPASNEPTQMRAIGRDLLRGHTASARLRIDRDGKEMDVVLNRYVLNNMPGYNYTYDGSSYPKDSSFQLLDPDIGYIFVGNLKASQIPQIMKTVKNTKGLVIDLRCYPSDFVVFELGKHLMLPTPFVKFSAGSVQTPGLFQWQSTLKVGQRGIDTYQGKVVILVNEVTQSSAEYHTMAFRQAPNAIVLGSITAAADGNVSPFSLPGGLQTMISGIGVNYPDGRETQRVGVGVDVEIHPTRQGIKEGRDELLEQAAKIIRANK